MTQLYSLNSQQQTKEYILDLFISRMEIKVVGAVISGPTNITFTHYMERCCGKQWISPDFAICEQNHTQMKFSLQQLH